MKQLTRLSLITALVMASAGIALALWITLTPQGARWLLTSLLPASGISFTAEEIEGRLIGPLLLTRVRVGMAQRRMEIDRLEMQWQPLQLFSGNLALQELTLAGVRIQDDTPPDNQPPSLAWPTLPAGAQRLDATITQLRLTDLSYRRRQEAPLLLTSYAGSVTWQDGLLSLGEFQAVAPSGRSNGSLSVGFKEPSLTADLAVMPTLPIGKIDRFSVRVRQKKESGSEPFGGIINLIGSAGSEKRLELSGEVGMAKDVLNLRGIRLTRPGKKDLVTAEGSLAFSAGKSVLSLQIQASDLDLSPELNVPTDLSGTLAFAGRFADGESPFTGSVSGTLRESTWLGQPLTGELQADYADDNLSLTRLALKGKGFDLQASGDLDQRLLLAARISDFSSLLPEASGTLSADGWVCWRNGELSGNLLGTGRRLAYAGTRLGAVTLKARRDPGRDAPIRLDASLQEVDFDGYRLKSAAVTVEGTDLRHSLNASLHSASAEIRLQLSAGYKNGLWAGNLSRLEGRDDNGPWMMTAPASFAVSSGKLSLSSLTLIANGAERLEVGFDLTLKPLSGQLSAQWHDLNLSRANPWLPSGTRLSGRSNGETTGTMLTGDRFELDGKTVIAGGMLHRNRGDGEVSLAFTSATASWNWREEALTGALALSFTEYGKVQATFRLPLAARLPLVIDPKGALRASLSGKLQEKGMISALFPSLLQKSFGEIDADLEINGTWEVPLVEGNLQLARAGAYLPAAGIYLKDIKLAVRLEKDLLRGDIAIATTDGGRLKGDFSSPAPRRLAMPESGELAAEWTGIDLALLKPWLPPDTRLGGRISGETKGIMLGGDRFELEGKAALSGGRLQQERGDGELNLAFPSATAAWNWRGEALTGALALSLSEYGKARTTFQLPLAARFPVVVNRQGPLQGTLSAQLQEKGILTALFPELVQESFGKLDADLVASGSWEVPQVGGTLRLAKAGAYLPRAGIHLQEVEVAARLEKNLIRIDSFRGRSGPGQIEGTALITLAGWRMISYQGRINGENFQTIHLPELQVLGTPQLNFSGTPQKLTLRGDLRLPEVHFVAAPAHTAIGPSSDVIREGTSIPVAKSPPLALDVQLRVLLGERVFVKVAGIDAQLNGGVLLSMSSLDKMTGSGEIKVVKGRFRTYGVNLEIVRGRLFFAGGPVDRPTLDFLALRTIGEVRAGVTVAGTLHKPLTRLYSEPPMPDVDILAYIVLGRPLGSNVEQADLVTRAASALLSSGQSGVVQEQLKNRLGLSTLEIQRGVGAGNGAMGYKPLEVTPPGALAGEQQPGMTETMLTVGKYLTPQLYISYGRSLFTGSNLFRVRYDIFKRWQIETQTGSESSADLFYKLEFK